MTRNSRHWLLRGRPIRVVVTPRASSVRLSALRRPDGNMEFRVWLTCVPEKGRANAQLIRFLADKAGLPPSRLAITHGRRGRVKTLRLLV